MECDATRAAADMPGRQQSQRPAGAGKPWVSRVRAAWMHSSPSLSDGTVMPLKPRLATALRANLLLFAVSTGAAALPCLGLILMFGMSEAGMPASAYLGGLLLVAGVITLVVRGHARRAFEDADLARKVQVYEKPPFGASIAGDCAQPWLVQLHLELRGLQCRD